MGYKQDTKNRIIPKIIDKKGLTGGTSWESSIVYYDLINKKVNDISGGFHSCKSIMYSVDFAEIEKFGIEVIMPNEIGRDFQQVMIQVL